MRRRSCEDNGLKMDLGMIVKTVVWDERELKERRKVDEDRIDWSDKVVVVEEEHEAETFIEKKETLANLEQNYEQKLTRPRMTMMEEDLRERLGRSREEARRSCIKTEEEERSSRMRRRSSEDNGLKMDLGMIVKTVVRDERDLKERRKVDEDMEVDSEKKKYMEKERELAKQRLMEKELLREERRLEMKERELDREKFRLKEKERVLEKRRLEAGELRSKLENYLKRAKEAKEGKKK